MNSNSDGKYESGSGVSVVVMVDALKLDAGDLRVDGEGEVRTHKPFMENGTAIHVDTSTNTAANDGSAISLVCVSSPKEQGVQKRESRLAYRLQEQDPRPPHSSPHPL